MIFGSQVANSPMHHGLGGFWGALITCVAILVCGLAIWMFLVHRAERTKRKWEAAKGDDPWFRSQYWGGDV